MQVSLQQKQNIIRFLHQRKLGKKSEPQMGFEPTNLRGGSWVRIPSGARISSRVSYFQIKTFYLSDANYATDDHTDAFSSLHTTSSPAPPPPQPSSNSQETARNQFKLETVGKSRRKVTMFWLGNENGFWFEKRDSQPLRCQSLLVL